MTVPPIISGLGKATNFKFGRYIQRVHTNKSRLTIWEKLERGRNVARPNVCVLLRICYMIISTVP